MRNLLLQWGIMIFRTTRYLFMVLSLLLIFYFLRVLYVNVNLNIYIGAIFLCFIIYFTYRFLPNISIFPISLVGLLCCLVWWFSTQPIPESDFLIYFSDAQRFLYEPFISVWITSKYPAVSMIYSAGMFFFGETYLSVSLVSILLWLAQIWVIRLILLQFNCSSKIIGIIVLMYIFFPMILVYTSVASSESLYILMVLLSIYCILLGRNNKYYFIASSIFLILAFYSRPTAIFFIPLFVFFLILINGIRNKGVYYFILPCILFLVSHAVLNYKYNNELTINSNRGMTSYVLLFGTNIEYVGSWNKSDTAFVNALKEQLVPIKEIDKIVRDEVKNRILQNPTEFINFVFTQKLQKLWQVDASIAYWSMNNKSKNIPYEILVFFNKINSYMYTVFLVSFIFSMFFWIKRIFYNQIGIRKFYMQCVLLSYIFMMCSFYILFEVQQRYVLSILPIILLFLVSVLSDSFRKKMHD